MVYFGVKPHEVLVSTKCNNSIAITTVGADKALSNSTIDPTVLPLSSISPLDIVSAWCELTGNTIVNTAAGANYISIGLFADISYDGGATYPDHCVTLGAALPMPASTTIGKWSIRDGTNIGPGIQTALINGTSIKFQLTNCSCNANGMTLTDVQMILHILIA
jgi:hypothetical protein